MDNLSGRPPALDEKHPPRGGAGWGKKGVIDMFFRKRKKTTAEKVMEFLTKDEFGKELVMIAVKIIIIILTKKVPVPGEFKKI